MITWVTVWFMAVSFKGNAGVSNSYAIPMQSKELCLAEAKKINDGYSVFNGGEKAKCINGQVPVVKK